MLYYIHLQRNLVSAAPYPLQSEPRQNGKKSPQMVVFLV